MPSSSIYVNSYESGRTFTKGNFKKAAGPFLKLNLPSKSGRIFTKGNFKNAAAPFLTLNFPSKKRPDLY